MCTSQIKLNAKFPLAYVRIRTRDYNLQARELHSATPRQIPYLITRNLRSYSSAICQYGGERLFRCYLKLADFMLNYIDMQAVNKNLVFSLIVCRSEVVKFKKKL